MKSILFFSIITSIPVIIITMFLMPVLGVCLLLFRFYLKKKNDISIAFIIMGFILVLPKALASIFDLINFSSNKILYFDTIVNSNIYDKLFPFGKILITIGVIVLIVSFIIKNLVSKIINKVQNGVSDYIQREEQREQEIKEKNDLIVRERQEAAKNTHTVTCPHCGADNIINTKVSRCKYCRRTIEYKE